MYLLHLDIESWQNPRNLSFVYFEFRNLRIYMGVFVSAIFLPHLLVSRKINDQYYENSISLLVNEYQVHLSLTLVFEYLLHFLV